MSLEQKIYFVLTDLDYKIQATDDSPTLRLFGKTENETVLVLLRDFLPYFYVSEKEGLVELLNGDPVIKRWVKKIDEVTRKKYFGGEELKLLKLFGSHPEQTPIIRERMQRAGYEVHEADIPFVKRFLLDTGIRGLNVLTVSSGQIITKDKNIIIDTSYLKVTPTPKSEISSVDYFYRIKLMAFDIEIDHIDETMQQLIEMKNKRITAISYAWGSTQLDEQKKTFILKEDSDIAEREIIYAFIKDLQRIQPDVLLTFNGDNFDLPYLLSRMSHLK
ncbi:MAG: 3'-5' exonuclease, partial [Candidatus Heimdallarchaeota archaeon]